MKKLTLADLMSAADYDARRPALRAEIMRHKRVRRVPLGPNATLHFEDRKTMRYQILELMRAERITDPTELAAELESYNPLIPDGANLKVTFMIEYPDEDERREKLRELVGIEEVISIQLGDCERVFPIANEDLPRSTPDKTSAVHFLRFEFPPATIAAARAGADWHVRCSHLNYSHETGPLPAAVVASLLGDFT